MPGCSDSCVRVGVEYVGVLDLKMDNYIQVVEKPVGRSQATNSSTAESDGWKFFARVPSSSNGRLKVLNGGR